VRKEHSQSSQHATSSNNKHTTRDGIDSSQEVKKEMKGVHKKHMLASRIRDYELQQQQKSQQPEMAMEVDHSKEMQLASEI